MKIACIQLAIGDDPKAARLTRAEKLIDAAAGADLILLPELWNVGFFDFEEYQAESEPLDGETVSRMAARARAVGAHLLAGSIVERCGDRLYNTSVLLDPAGQVVASYRKIHLFGYGSRETELLSRGTGPVVAKTALGVLGLTTCYDLRFPELYRTLVDRGTEMFLVPAAWPYPRLEHWLVLAQARALENLAFLVGCNGAGITRGRQLLGHSLVVNPWGVPVARAGDGQSIVWADVDLAEVAATRAEFPALADRVWKP